MYFCPFPLLCFYSKHTYKPSSVYVIIYLGLKLLSSSLPPLKTAEQAFFRFPRGVAPGRVYVASQLPDLLVSSYLAFPPLPFGGYFLSHYP